MFGTTVFPSARHTCLENRPIAQNQANKPVSSENKKESCQLRKSILVKEQLLIIFSVPREEESLKDKESATGSKMQDCHQRTSLSVEDAHLQMQQQVTSKLNSGLSFQRKMLLKQSKDANKGQETMESQGKNINLTMDHHSHQEA